MIKWFCMLFIFEQLLAQDFHVTIEEIKEEINKRKIYFGSTVRIEHQSSAYFLHSHLVSYGSGSGQQSVTGMQADNDYNSLWTIKECHNQPLKNMCGDCIRLEHMLTFRNLHSHPHQAPFSGNQEVSAYGDNGNGDASDDWIVECIDQKSGDNFQASMYFYLKHKLTSKYLRSNKKIISIREIVDIIVQLKVNLKLVLNLSKMQMLNGKYIQDYSINNHNNQMMIMIKMVDIATPMDNVMTLMMMNLRLLYKKTCDLYYYKYNYILLHLSFMRSKQGTTIQKSEKSIKSQSEYSDHNISYTSTRKDMLSERLVNSGEQARLEEYLKQKFIDVGWKDDLKNHAKQFIRENGLKIVHKEDLYKLLSVKGKETVPMKLREDIVRRLERFIIELEQEEEGEYDDDDDDI